MAKLTPDQKNEFLAKALCKIVGIEPVDSMDGSANWFIFADDAKKIISDLESRGFQVWDWVDLKGEDNEKATSSTTTTTD